MGSSRVGFQVSFWPLENIFHEPPANRNDSTI